LFKYSYFYDIILTEDILRVQASYAHTEFWSSCVYLFRTLESPQLHLIIEPQIVIISAVSSWHLVRR